jgi:hypothetical protein
MTLKSARVAALARAASGIIPQNGPGPSIGSIVRAASASSRQAPTPSAEAIVFGLASGPHSQHSGQPFPRPAVIFGTQAGQIELAPPSPRCAGVCTRSSSRSRRRQARIAADKPLPRS